MIIIITGDIGSGKSISLTRYALMRILKGQKIYTNYTIKNLNGKERKQYHMLDLEEFGSFDYWKRELDKHWTGGMSIVLDEIHNLIDARRSLSNRSVKVTQALAQIRKIVKGHSANHLICSTQYLRQVDCRLRDLAQHMINCHFIKGRTKDEDMVVQLHHVKNYGGDFVYKNKTWFYASKIYPYFDTHELIDFGKKEGYVG